MGRSLGRSGGAEEGASSSFRERKRYHQRLSDVAPFFQLARHSALASSPALPQSMRGEEAATRGGSSLLLFFLPRRCALISCLSTLSSASQNKINLHRRLHLPMGVGLRSDRSCSSDSARSWCGKLFRSKANTKIGRQRRRPANWGRG